MHPIINKDRLMEDFYTLGIRSGMEILVHSSLSSMGYVEGGASTVIDSLLAAINPSLGTLIVPTLTGTFRDNPACPPEFHVKDSKCWTGAIPETLRQMKESRRSLNPTHSIAATGKSADSIVTGHEDCLTPCGYGSPYYRLCRRGGRILLLGVTLDSNTTIHTAEELVGVPYHMQIKPTECAMIDMNLHKITRMVKLHDWGTPRNFRILEESMLDQGIMVSGYVGQARSYLIDAARMLEYICEKLTENPKLLVK